MRPANIIKERIRLNKDIAYEQDQLAKLEGYYRRVRARREKRVARFREKLVALARYDEVKR